MLKDVPLWMWIVSAIVLGIGVASFIYSSKECGFGRALLLGSGAIYAAATGLCD